MRAGRSTLDTALVLCAGTSAHGILESSLACLLLPASSKVTVAMCSSLPKVTLASITRTIAVSYTINTMHLVALGGSPIDVRIQNLT